MDEYKKELKFNVSDLVWVHLRKERFPLKRNSKLSPRSDDPFKILAKVNDNAYKVELSGVIISATFNVADLQPFMEDEPLPSLRSRFFEEGEDDGDPSMLIMVSKEKEPKELNLGTKFFNVVF